MVALKGAEIDAYIAQPDARPIALVYGVGRRAGARTRRGVASRPSVDDVDDPFALVRVEGDTLAAHPERLLEEAHTVPLFGGRRALWVKAGGANIAAAVEALLADPPQKDCRVVIEAGDLRKGAPLRALSSRPKARWRSPATPTANATSRASSTEELRAAKLSHCARRTGAAGLAARRRSPGLAQRDPQARAACAWQGACRGG